MTLVSRTVAVLSAAAVAVALSLTGCAGQSSDFDPEVAGGFQSAVLEVSQLSADADYAAALLSLDEFEVHLKDARARGDITEERYESILAAVAQVRADLQAAIDAQSPAETEAPAPTAPVDDGEGDDESESGNSGNNGNGNQGSGNEKDNKGKDKKDDKKDDNGNGNGKGKD